MQSYIVIGGGLAGLTAANALAGPGRQVVLYEQSEHLGGRAATQSDRGFLLNLGPHALYRGGRARATFQQWRIPIQGAVPDQAGAAFLTRGGRKYDLVRNAAGLLFSPIFGLTEKLDAIRALTRVQRGTALPGESMEQWLCRNLSSPRVRDFIAALTRVSTYTAHMPDLSARAALRQIRLAISQSVLYLDGGWQTIVDGLARRAQSRGVVIRTGQTVPDFRSLDADGIVLAVPPHAAEKISGVTLPRLHPVRMATLDLALCTLPPGSARFALGLDQPLYLSLHSAAARLAPDGAALVHVGKYLGPADTDAALNRAELERHADLCLPGWRQHAEIVRFFPNLIVTHAAADPQGRPDVDALGLDRVTIAGDWVGPEAMLADAAVSSALRAATVVQRQKTMAA